MADSVDEATATAHRLWPNAALRGQLSQDLPTPRHVAWATAPVTADQIASSIPCGPDPAPVIEALRQAWDRGINQVHLHQIGPDQEAFFRLWRDEILPALPAPMRASSDHRVSSRSGV